MTSSPLTFAFRLSINKCFYCVDSASYAIESQYANELDGAGGCANKRGMLQVKESHAMDGRHQSYLRGKSYRRVYSSTDCIYT